MGFTRYWKPKMFDVLGRISDAHGWLNYNAYNYISFLISYANLNDFVVRWLSLVELKTRHHAFGKIYFISMYLLLESLYMSRGCIFFDILKQSPCPYKNKVLT